MAKVNIPKKFRKFTDLLWEMAHHYKKSKHEFSMSLMNIVLITQLDELKRLGHVEGGLSLGEDWELAREFLYAVSQKLELPDRDAKIWIASVNHVCEEMDLNEDKHGKDSRRG